MIMRELHQNMHFYDTRSTRYLAGSSIENFQKAEKIEVFIAYIMHYKSDLFRRAPSRRAETFAFDCTNLSSVFIPYDFFEYSCGNRQVFFSGYQRYSLNLQMFVNFLARVRRSKIEGAGGGGFCPILVEPVGVGPKNLKIFVKVCFNC